MAHYTVVSATAVPGKAKEAVAAVKDLAKHYNETQTGTVEFLQSMDGPANRYHWVNRQESAAAAETAMAQWQEDPKFQELNARSHELWQDLETHRYQIL